MELLFEEPPCKIDDVIRLSYSFENLHKFLNFLVLNDKDSFTKLHDVKLKLTEMDDLKRNLEDVTVRIFKCEGRFTEIENIVNSFFKKFSDLDGKIVSAVHKLNIYSEDIKTVNTKLAAHDENINSLNRLTEENIKASFKQGEVLEKIRNTNETLLDKTDKSEKAILKLSNEILRFNDVEKNIRENSSKIEDNSKNISDLQYHCNSKFSDFDSRIFAILDSLGEISKQLEKKGNGVGMNLNSINNNNNSANEASNGQIVSEIGKTNREIDNMKKLFREFNEKIEKIAKTNSSLEEQVKEISKSDYKQKKNSNANLNGGNSYINCDLDGKGKEGTEGAGNLNNLSLEDPNAYGFDLQADNDSIKQNMELLLDRMKMSQEMFKSLNTNLGHKTEKSEFEKLTRSVSTEMEKLNKRISELSTSTEQKLKSLQNASKHGINQADSNDSSFSEEENPESNKESKQAAATGTTANKKAASKNKKSKTSDSISANLTNGSNFEFDEGIINMTRAIIARELDSKDEFAQMREFIQEQTTRCESSKADVDSLFASVVEIRSALSAQKLEELHGKISQIDFALKKQKSVFEERFKSLEGDEALAVVAGDANENAENSAAIAGGGGGSVKDNIKSLNAHVKMQGDKIEKATMRLDNMNNEILGKVKKDLSAESAKILLEFKGDLKNSIMSIEEQLREKVDKFSLDEFGKYVNEKLSQEMNKKLDRTDLKKNNSLINKKIDTLENKISKTLVDTLIDLQMEEAPLIFKKPLGGGAANEKCASCNQFVLNTTFINEDNLNETITKNYNTSINNTNNPSKIKFKNVQESCYKFGAGSYSRYLSNIDNVNEELRVGKQNVTHLPEINSNKNTNNNNTAKKFNFVVTNNVSSEAKLKNKILGEIAEKHYLNTMLNEELEKKNFNPENLLRTANKLYESVEKEKRVINSNNFSNK